MRSIHICFFVLVGLRVQGRRTAAFTTPARISIDKTNESSPQDYCCLNFGELPKKSVDLGKAFQTKKVDLGKRSPTDACKPEGFIASFWNSTNKLMPKQCCESFDDEKIDFMSFENGKVTAKFTTIEYDNGTETTVVSANGTDTVIIGERDHIVWQKEPAYLWSCYCRVLARCIYGTGKKGLRRKDAKPGEKDLASRLVCENLVGGEVLPTSVIQENDVRSYFTGAYAQMFAEGNRFIVPDDFCGLL